VDYKKLGILLGVAFVIFFIVNQPTASAGMVKDALGGIGHAADKLALFVKSLFA
jgi:hypothetical protein